MRQLKLNIFDVCSDDTLRQQLKTSLQNEVVTDKNKVHFVEMALTGLLMGRPYLTTDGLVRLIVSSRNNEENEIESILTGFQNLIQKDGYITYPKLRHCDRVILYEFYPAIRKASTCVKTNFNTKQNNPTRILK